MESDTSLGEQHDLVEVGKDGRGWLVDGAYDSLRSPAGSLGGLGVDGRFICSNAGSRIYYVRHAPGQRTHRLDDHLRVPAVQPGRWLVADQDGGVGENLIRKRQKILI